MTDTDKIYFKDKNIFVLRLTDKINKKCFFSCYVKKNNKPNTVIILDAFKDTTLYLPKTPLSI